MAKIVHRAILNMRSLGLNKQLEYMWCSSSTRSGDRFALDKVLLLPTSTLNLFVYVAHSIQYATLYAIMGVVTIQWAKKGIRPQKQIVKN
jgi:hypothetical protein